MRPDRLQDKERSARLSQKGNVSLCAIRDSGRRLEHSGPRERQRGCAGQKARTESDIPNLQSKRIEKGLPTATVITRLQSDVSDPQTPVRALQNMGFFQPAQL